MGLKDEYQPKNEKFLNPADLGEDDVIVFVPKDEGTPEETEHGEMWRFSGVVDAEETTVDARAFTDNGDVEHVEIEEGEEVDFATGSSMILDAFLRLQQESNFLASSIEITSNGVDGVGRVYDVNVLSA